MKKQLGILIFFLSCLLSLSIFAEFKPVLIGRTQYGLIVGFNRADLHFVVKLYAKDPKYADQDQNIIFNIDNNIIQFISKDIGSNIKENKIDEILNKVADSELSYQQKEMGLKVKSEKKKIIINGDKALFWTMEVDDPSNEAKYTNLSILKKNRYIISINYSTDKLVSNLECLKMLKKIANDMIVTDDLLTYKSMEKYVN